MLPHLAQVSEATHALLPDVGWQPTGGVEVKGKGRWPANARHEVLPVFVSMGKGIACERGWLLWLFQQTCCVS